MRFAVEYYKESISLGEVVHHAVEFAEMGPIGILFMTKLSANKAQKVITRRMGTMLTVIIARDIRKKMSLFKSLLIKLLLV